MAKKKTNLLTWVFVGVGLALVSNAIAKPTTPTPPSNGNNGNIDDQPIILPPQPTQYPIVFMKFNEDVKLLQRVLGFTGREVDGKIGPNTFKRIQAKLPGYPQSFVISDFAQLQRLINALK